MSFAMTWHTARMTSLKKGHVTENGWPLPDKLAAMDDPHGLLLALRQYNDVNEQKIQRREHLQKPAAVSPDSWM